MYFDQQIHVATVAIRYISTTCVYVCNICVHTHIYIYIYIYAYIIHEHVH